MAGIVTVSPPHHMGGKGGVATVERHINPPLACSVSRFVRIGELLDSSTRPTYYPFGTERDVTDNHSDPPASIASSPPHKLLHTMNDIFRRESERLKTFENWPIEWFDKHKLAMTGMFYTGEADKVKCYFCEVEIGRWERDDQPITEHLRWSPNCPLLRRRTTNNEPINSQALDQALPPISYDICGANDRTEVRPTAHAEGSIMASRMMTSTAVNTEQLINGGNGNGGNGNGNGGGGGSNATGSALTSVAYECSPSFMSNTTYFPEYPEYAIEAARLRSFAEWPRHMKQKPQQLAEAGFFYTGVGDRVKCFCCGCGLKDWDVNDDPWEQHAQWMSRCRYVKLMKGQIYIDATLERQKMARKQEEAAANSPTTTSVPSFHNEATATPKSSASLSNSASSTECRYSIDVVSPTSDLLAAPTTATPSASTSSSSSSSLVLLSQQEDAHRRVADSEISESEQQEQQQQQQQQEAIEGEQGRDRDAEQELAPSHEPKSLDKKSNSSIPEEKLCKICYAGEYNTAFLPCGHVVACAKCASSVTKCPLCRKPFTDVMRVYFS